MPQTVSNVTLHRRNDIFLAIVLLALTGNAKAQFRDLFFSGKTTRTTTLAPDPTQQNRNTYISQYLFEGDVGSADGDHPVAMMAKAAAAIAAGQNKRPASSYSNDDAGDITYQLASVRQSSERWPSSVVPYKFHATVTEKFKARLINATRYIMSHVCVQLVQFDASKHDMFFTWYEAPRSFGCISTIGRRDNGSYIVLEPGCTDGNIIHELMHVLGFYHEQSRTDRDGYVTIVYENINPTDTRQFQKYNERDLDELGYQYDYGSIMHYPDNAFAIHGDLTTIKTNRPGAHIGQRASMSPLDIKKARKLFNCQLHCNAATQFKCNDQSACILVSQRCNGRSDCNDGSDETGCKIACSLTEFACSNKCIRRSWLCDGQLDCLDGADERAENCPQSCSNGYFRCNRGQRNKNVSLNSATALVHCIPLWRYCDGNVDCPGGDDENNAKCRGPPPTISNSPSLSTSTTPPTSTQPAALSAGHPSAIEAAADPCSIPTNYYDPRYYQYCYYNYRARQNAQQYGTYQAYNTLLPSDGTNGVFYDPIEAASSADTINTVCGMHHSSILKARAGMIGLNMSFIIDNAICSNLVVFGATFRDANVLNDDDESEHGTSLGAENRKIQLEMAFSEHARDFIAETVAYAKNRKQQQLREQQYADRRMEVYVALDVSGVGVPARLMSDLVRNSANEVHQDVVKKESVKFTRRRARAMRSGDKKASNTSAVGKFADNVRAFARSLDVDGVVLDWRSAGTTKANAGEVIADYMLTLVKEIVTALRRDVDKGPGKIDLFLGLIISPSTFNRTDPKTLQDIILAVDFVMYSDDTDQSKSAAFSKLEPLNKLFVATVLNENNVTSDFFKSTSNLTQKFFIGLATGGKNYLLPKTSNQNKKLNFGEKASGAGFGGGLAASNPAILARNELCRLFSSTKKQTGKNSTNNYTFEDWQFPNISANESKKVNLYEPVAFRLNHDFITYETSCSFAQKIALFKQHNKQPKTTDKSDAKTNNATEFQRKFAGIFINDITMDDTLGECSRGNERAGGDGDQKLLFPLLSTLIDYSLIEDTVKLCLAKTGIN